MAVSPSQFSVHKVAIIIDYTESKLQQSSNYDLRTLHFWIRHTRKSLVGIFPNRVRLIFSEIYPESISYSNDSEMSHVISSFDRLK